MFNATMFNYQGKNVVVVGGTSGINLAIAVAFAQAGANVAVASRSQEKLMPQYCSCNRPILMVFI